jgi:hypothetical protein
VSSSLHWRPVPPPPVDNQLSTDLKFRLRAQLWNDHEEWNEPYTINKTFPRIMGFLEGLAAAGTEDAKFLLDKINEHGEVQVWIGDGEGPR